MNLNEIFPNGAEFMDWLANNCYSCEKLGDGVSQNNPYCELEPIISYSNLDHEIDENLTKIIIEKGKLCKCKNFTEIIEAKIEEQNNLQEKLFLAIQADKKQRGSVLEQYRQALIEMKKKCFSHREMAEKMNKVGIKISRQAITNYLRKRPISTEEFNSEIRIPIEKVSLHEELLLEIQSTVKHRGGILEQYRHLLIEMVKRYFTQGDMVEMLSKINVKISRQSISSYLLKVPITRDELNAKTRIAIKTIARQGKE